MIEHRSGDIFESGAEALVNPVNCVGISGNGLALGFKRRFPDNHEMYAHYCKHRLLAPGHAFVVDRINPPKWIINVATKDHWSSRSRLQHIEEGAESIRSLVHNSGIKSIAIPALGCGLGSLNWKHVLPLLEYAFSGLMDVHVILYGPVKEIGDA